MAPIIAVIASMLLAPSLSSAAFPAEWIDAVLPNGGRISTLARIPATAQNHAALIAGSERGTLYRSVSEGSRWDLVFSDAGEPIRSLLVDGDILLAAAGTRGDAGLWDCWGPTGSCPSPWATGGLFRSADRGATWKRVDSITGAVMGLARTNNAWYAAGSSGLWSSVDKGASWQRVPPDTGWTPYAADMSAFVSDGTLLYALARQTLYSARPDAPKGPLWKRETGIILALAGQPGRIYVSAKPFVSSSLPGFAEAGIFFRADAVQAWQRLSPDTAAALSVAGDTVLAGSAESMRMSSNRGFTWKSFAAPLSNLGRSGTLLAYGEYAFGAGNDSLGVRKAPFASGGWTLANEGLRDYAAYVRFAGGKLFSNDVSGDLLRREDHDVWSSYPLGISAYVETYRSLYVGQAGAYVMAGANQGLFTIDPAGHGSRLDILGVDGVASGGIWSAAFQEGSWTLRRCLAADTLACVLSPLTGFPPKGPRFGDTPQPHYRGMAARGDSLYLAIDSVLYRSGDRGDTWLAAGAIPDWVRSLGFAGDRLYGMLPWGGRPFQTNMLSAWNGATRSWETQNLSGAPGVFREAAFRGQEIYLATDSGIFARAAGAAAWVDLSGGLPARNLRSVAVAGDTLAVGLMQGGVFTRILGPLTVPISGRTRTRRIAYPPDGWMREYRADGRLR